MCTMKHYLQKQIITYTPMYWEILTKIILLRVFLVVYLWIFRFYPASDFLFSLLSHSVPLSSPKTWFRRLCLVPAIPAFPQWQLRSSMNRKWKMAPSNHLPQSKTQLYLFWLDYLLLWEPCYNKIRPCHWIKTRSQYRMTLS